MNGGEEFRPGAEAQVAVNAFREVETAMLRLAVKELALRHASANLALNGSEQDRSWYFTETEKIRVEFDEKARRAKV